MVPRTLAPSILALALVVPSACSSPAENAKPTPGLEVSWCRLQPLPQAETAPGRAFSAAGRVLVPGLTDRTPGPDLDAKLDAKLGMGPYGTAPNGPGENGAWTWRDASPVPDWNGAEAGEPAVDEYRLSTSAPDVGQYGLAFAFSADAGRTWRLCDLGGSPDVPEEGDGFSADQIGMLVVRSSTNPCDPDPCAVTPVPSCDGDTILRYTGPGTCTPDGTTFACDYPAEHGTDCGESDQACLVGPSGAACVTPVPVDFCQHLGPTDISYAGQPIPFDGLVRIAGITDRTHGVDADPAVRVAFGYGWPGAQPDGAGWAWFESGIEGPPGWTDEALPLESRGADVYRATFDGAPPGEYDTAWRFSADGGATWTYCDLDGAGGGDPYDPANAGHLVVPED